MRLALAAVLSLVLAPPAWAAGQDSLLSGYGGPGDGEQALLGQTLIGDSGATKPASGGAAATPAPTPQAIYEPAPAAQPQQQQSTPVTPAKPAKPRPAAEPQATPTRPTPQASRPLRHHDTPAVAKSKPVAAPAPLDGRTGALLAVIAVLVLLLAGCARRLAVSAARARRPMPSS